MHNLQGTYTIKLDGKEVYSSKNIVTDVGRSIIKRFLIGSYAAWGEALGIGIGSTAASASDVRLGFEVDRRSVSSKNIFKAKNNLSSLNISSATTATFTTVETNKFVVGDTVTLANTGVTALNNTFTVTTPLTNNTFTVTSSGLTTGTTTINGTAIGEENIVLRAVFPDTLAVTIREIGVFPLTTNVFSGAYNNKLISDFSEDGWKDGSNNAGTQVTTNSLVGSKNLTVTTTSLSLDNQTIVFDGYTSSDVLSLAVYNGNTTAKTVTVTFTDTSNASNTKAYTFSVAGSVGSQILTTTLGSVGMSSASKITVVSSADTVQLDALSVVTTDTYGVINNLVSRSVLGIAITKTAGQQLEIEYSMRLG